MLSLDSEEQIVLSGYVVARKKQLFDELKKIVEDETEDIDNSYLENILTELTTVREIFESLRELS